jgi:hypothetical protein
LGLIVVLFAVVLYVAEPSLFQLPTAPFDRSIGAGTPAHQEYVFSDFSLTTEDGGKADNALLHPGENMVGVWRARPDHISTSNAPVQVTLTLYLYGSFATDAERQQFRDAYRERVIALENFQEPQGTLPAGSALPVQTNTWSSVPWITNLRLGDDVKPGLYVVEQIALAPGLWSFTSQTAITVASVSG